MDISLIFDNPFVDVIKHYEGWFSHPYRCPAGKWTIGWGHLCRKDHPPITKEGRGTEYLMKDLAVALYSVGYLAPTIIRGPEHRLISLVSWTFNLGAGNLAASTLLNQLRAERWEAAAKEILRWNRATGTDGVKRVLPGLVKRRNSEAHMFLTGEVKIF